MPVWADYPSPSIPSIEEPRIGFYLGSCSSWLVAGWEASRGGAGSLPLPSPSDQLQRL